MALLKGNQLALW